jgi:hypothetical protein
MLSLFLGAGFSKWSVNLPVANELFDFDISIWGPREEHRLNHVKALKREWDIKHPNSIPEKFISDMLRLDEKEKQAVLWYIVRRLSEPFIWKEYHAQKMRRHVLMIDENRKLRIEGIRRTQNFLSEFNPSGLAGIITTNYDLVVEYALGTNGFNYGIPNQILTGRGPYPISQWKNPVKLSGDVPLAKIHGSISWDENGCYTDGRRGLTGNALIVPPTPEKRPPEALKRTWKLAKLILRKSRNLIIFGFAFNLYDMATINLLKDSGHDIKNILLIDINPKVDIAEELWPQAKISQCKPTIDSDLSANRWLEYIKF